MFTAMLQKCVERDVVAICLYIPRKFVIPRFVALIPQVHIQIIFLIRRSGCDESEFEWGNIFNVISILFIGI